MQVLRVSWGQRLPVQWRFLRRVCVEGAQTYKCVCDDGYTGDYCEAKIGISTEALLAVAEIILFDVFIVVVVVIAYLHFH